MNSLNCIYCNYSTKNKYNYSKHLKTKKHDLSMIKNDNSCIRCKRIFKRKFNLQQHMKRKNPCKIITPQKTHKNAQKTHKNAQKTHNSTQNYECDYCDKSFTRSDTRTRHVKKYCKNKPIPNITNNITNNTINNNFHIIINNYGSENKDYLFTQEIYNKLKNVTSCEEAILLLLREKYTNENHIENWNITYPYLKNNIARLRLNGEWVDRHNMDIFIYNIKQGSKDIRIIYDRFSPDYDLMDKKDIRLEGITNEVDDLFHPLLLEDNKKQVKKISRSHTEDLYGQYKKNKLHYKI